MSIRRRSWKTPAGEKREGFEAAYKDQYGKRRRKLFNKRKDADAWLVKARSEVVAGTHTPDSATATVDDAARLWLEACRIGRNENPPIEPQTLRSYATHVRLHISPLIGSERLSRLTAPKVHAFRAALLEKLSRAMAKKVLGSLRAILTEAQSRGLIAQNVARGVRVADSLREKEEVEIPEVDEVKRILATAKVWADHDQDHVRKAWRRYYALLLTAALTGMRASELRGLSREDLDLKNKRIKVTQRADEHGIIGPPKSRAGRRSIPISDDLCGVLREWILMAPGGRFVFPNWQGNVETHANIINRCWWPVMKRANVAKRYKFHSLRHFHASRLIASGASAKEVMAEMGHASVQMTFDTYGHLFRSDEDARKARANDLAAGLV